MRRPRPWYRSAHLPIAARSPNRRERNFLAFGRSRWPQAGRWKTDGSALQWRDVLHAEDWRNDRRPFLPRPGPRRYAPGWTSSRRVGRARERDYRRWQSPFQLPSGDHPAVLRQLGDWAEESRLPMLLTVCIEAGRKTLTHTSWTGPAPVSRKWMSGQAAALAALNDRCPFVNSIASSSLRDPEFPKTKFFSHYCDRPRTLVWVNLAEP